jgi:hypothetical protein
MTAKACASFFWRILLPCHQPGQRPAAGFSPGGDYQAFLKALAHACIEVPMAVLGLPSLSAVKVYHYRSGKSRNHVNTMGAVAVFASICLQNGA